MTTVFEALVVTRVVVVVVGKQTVGTVRAFRVLVPKALLALLPGVASELLARIREVEEFIIVARVFIVDDDLVVATPTPLDRSELLRVTHLKTVTLNEQVSFLCLLLRHVVYNVLEELLHGNLADYVLIDSFTAPAFYSAFLPLLNYLRLVIVVVMVAAAAVQADAPTRSAARMVEGPRLDHC